MPPRGGPQPKEPLQGHTAGQEQRSGWKPGIPPTGQGSAPGRHPGQFRTEQIQEVCEGSKGKN